MSFDYFIGNISAKKYQNAFTCVKVIANQRWDVFETRCMQYDRSPQHVEIPLINVVWFYRNASGFMSLTLTSSRHFCRQRQRTSIDVTMMALPNNANTLLTARYK